MLFVVYKIFIGALLVAFIGVGIAAFMPEPTAPTPPPAVLAPGAIQPSPQVEQEVQAYRQEVESYRHVEALYSRDVAVIAAVAGILMLIVSVTALRATSLFSDGFVLGGIFTFTYSVLRGFMAEDNMVRFLIVSAGLLIAMALGYVRFIRPQENASAAMVEPSQEDTRRRAA